MSLAQQILNLCDARYVLGVTRRKEYECRILLKSDSLEEIKQNLNVELKRLEELYIEDTYRKTRYEVIDGVIKGLETT